MELLFGILCGIALSLFFSFGAAFFQLLQIGVQDGFRKGVAFALGVFLCDAAVVFLMLTFLKNVDMYNVIRNPWVASIGCVVVAYMGYRNFTKSAGKAEKKSSSKVLNACSDISERHATKRRSIITRLFHGTGPRALMFQGFMLNFVNPLIWIFWISVIALTSGEMDIPTNHMYLFFVGVLGSTFGLDIVKCKLASLLTNIITPKLLNIFNKATGVILWCFAGYLLVSMLVFQFDPEARKLQEEKDKNQQSMQVIKAIDNGLNKGINNIKKDSGDKSTVFFDPNKK